MRMNWKFNTDEWLKIKRGNRKRTILVVDDEGFLVDILFEVLDSHGYSVLTATSGAEALKIAKKAESIDLLLTDLIMKPMNGIMLADQIKQTNPQIKVLFMSGYTEDYIRENLGIHNVPFLIKPISADDLLEKIPELLGN
jgi:two-component system, cell cycle sensor histidine kinase and response regulator CckA